MEVEPRPDGSREIEIELKWSDDKSKVQSMLIRSEYATM